MMPVCLIESSNIGLRVTDRGASLLESLKEPVAIICLAGQYRYAFSLLCIVLRRAENDSIHTLRTGKSFFLNQLASRSDDLPWISTGMESASVDSKGTPCTKTKGFRVGPTTESCTRGIWLWAPQPPVRNPAGQLVLFMDTEGMASTDNDESYDAKIFSLGLLLSSFFVFNTIGVIDEGAIDRLYLVSELTKYVCVSAHHSSALALDEVVGASPEESLLSDDIEESHELAPHFPPFAWLLRDFLLDMKNDGNSLTANQYLEKALDARKVSVTASNSRRARQIERNRIRASIRSLFRRRLCFTLVRPVNDESNLRRAAELPDTELRPEFVEQMADIRRRLLSSVTAKEILGTTLDGPQIASLARCYTETLNSGAVPDIKAAWEYVSDATCQAALAASKDLYDQLMDAASGKKPSKMIKSEWKREDNDKKEIGLDDSENESDKVAGGPKILSQSEFQAIYKDAKEQALTLYKLRSLEGSSRTECFQKLKQHMRSQRAAHIARLQTRSGKFCLKVLAKLRDKFLTRPLAAGVWDGAANKEKAFQATMQIIEEVYERKARGPAMKTVFHQFLRVDSLAFFETLYQRIVADHEQKTLEWCHARKQLEQQHALETIKWKHQLHEKSLNVQQLMEAKAHNEEKAALLAERLTELQSTSVQQAAVIADLENERKHQNGKIEKLRSAAMELTREVEKTQIWLQRKEEDLVKVEAESRSAKIELTKLLESLRVTHQRDEEDWMLRAADQTARRAVLRRQLKKLELDAQRHEREVELLESERRQLRQLYEAEIDARAQLERNYSLLREDNEKLDMIQQNAAQHIDTTKATEREHSRNDRIQSDHEVELVLRDCVSDVVHLASEEKIRTLREERRMLHAQIGDLHEKISTLPDFYIRQIFCAPEPVPSFFDALTFVVGN
ncbi:uncharacterized protein CCR75_006044 [Bremia lactucae]|uniref:GB1/RHD3-type G domain-containing protein n=1 Tax=Bremia lactucae TaxID=4779 RepID=A0A976IIY5_BRELC|nr:hypothetical protein CCR75_006044 [Bremia lactucae]